MVYRIAQRIRRDKVRTICIIDPFILCWICLLDKGFESSHQTGVWIAWHKTFCCLDQEYMHFVPISTKLGSTKWISILFMMACKKHQDSSIFWLLKSGSKYQIPHAFPTIASHCSTLFQRACIGSVQVTLLNLITMQVTLYSSGPVLVLCRSS